MFIINSIIVGQPEVKESQSGKEYVKFSTPVNVGSGDNRTTLWISVMAFGKASEAVMEMVANAPEGVKPRVSIIGNLKVNTYEHKASGETRVNATLLAGKITAQREQKEGEMPPPQVIVVGKAVKASEFKEPKSESGKPYIGTLVSCEDSQGEATLVSIRDYSEEAPMFEKEQLVRAEGGLKADIYSSNGENKVALVLLTKKVTEYKQKAAA